MSVVFLERRASSVILEISLEILINEKQPQTYSIGNKRDSPFYHYRVYTVTKEVCFWMIYSE